MPGLRARIERLKASSADTSIRRAATLLSIGAETGSSERTDLERAVRRGFGDSVSRTGKRVVDRSLGIQPTIRVAVGTPVRILVKREPVLKPLGRTGWP